MSDAETMSLSRPTQSTPTRGRVDIDAVSIVYGGRRGVGSTALEQTSLTLAPSSFTAIIGPSGCGKSTLLNAVAGFVEPASGAIRIDGQKVEGPSPEVGVIFQQYALFPWFTAIGNVKFALKRFAVPRDELERRALQALAEVGLNKQSHKFPGQLSGGMKQRVAIARTLSLEPKVLLMDEPFGALDAQTRLAMHELLLAVWSKHRPTILFVTHDVDEALLLADTVHVMSAAPGRIVRSYTIEMARPRKVETLGPGLLAIRAEILTLLKPPNPDES